MPRILVHFAHPLFERSRANKILTRYYDGNKELLFLDLYQRYPEFDIDIEKEKQLLLEHDIIVWHHPFYWYSCPPLLKQWIDMVLEVGWAYGPGGTALQGKKVMQVITTGGAQDAYANTGHNRFTIRQFLAPFEQTARLCKMEYLPPFVVHHTHRLSLQQIHQYGEQLTDTVRLLSQSDAELPDLSRFEYFNDYLQSQISA